MTTKPPFVDLATLLVWLDTLSPPDRLRIARLLGNTTTSRELSRAADAMVYDMTRTASRAEVADRLDTTVRAVQRAISTHIERTGAEARRGPKRTSAIG